MVRSTSEEALSAGNKERGIEVQIGNERNSKQTTLSVKKTMKESSANTNTRKTSTHFFSLDFLFSKRRPENKDSTSASFDFVF